MRKERRENVWQDPRFRKKKDRPKPIKLGALGDMPAPILQRAKPVAAPCPPGARPVTAVRAGMMSTGPSATSSPKIMSLGGPGRPAASRAPAGLMRAQVEAAAAVAAAAAARPAPLSSAGRPKYRPGSAIVQRPMTAATPVVVVAPPAAAPQAPCPRPSYRPQAPCPPAPCPPAPCPPEPCPPEPCPQVSYRAPATRAPQSRLQFAFRPQARPQASYRSPPPCPPEPCPQVSCRSPEPCPQASYRSPEPCPQASHRSPEPCPQVSYRSPEPCPPDPCAPSPRPGPSGLRTPGSGLRPPSGLRTPGSGLRPPSGLRTPGSGLRPPGGGLRPPGGGLCPPSRAPTVTTARTVMVRRSLSPPPCPPEPCPPEPCPPEPCPPPPCPPDPCEPCLDVTAASTSFSIPTVSSIRRSSGLRKPSRLMGSISLSRPKPQKIVLLPGDVDPNETTVITVEPPAPQLVSQRQSPELITWVPIPSVSLDLSPPSMDSIRREPEVGRPTSPYIPPEIVALGTGEDICSEEESDEPCTPERSFSPAPQRFYEAPKGPLCAIEEDSAEYEVSEGLLVDLAPATRCRDEPEYYVEPVDLITFAPQDPFSPERVCRPPSPVATCSPPPNPWSPPKDPYPMPSKIQQQFTIYPRYQEAFSGTFHPILEFARLPKKERPPSPKLSWGGRSPNLVDREVVARSVPFNPNISTICKDDSDEDLGLLPECIGGGFEDPFNYQAIMQQERIEREQRRQQRLEEERQQKGPSLAETTEMLARIRERESRRRAEMCATLVTEYKPPSASLQAAKEGAHRILARARRLDLMDAWGGPELDPCPPPREEIQLEVPETYDALGAIELDDMDLDAIDMMELGPDESGAW